MRIITLAAILIVLLPLCAVAQRGTAPSAVPDITGSWERFRGGAGQARELIPPAAPQPPLKAQYLKEWQARNQAAREADAKGTPLATNATLCLPEGMPAMMGATFPLEILQSKGQVTIIEEAFTQVRRIFLDQPQKAVDDVEPGFYGFSVGHWEGDTLLADTVGVKESVRTQNVPHSEQMRIKEKFRLVSPDVLWDEITVEDPVTLDKPWTYTVAYRRNPSYKLLEYICEDNREYTDQSGLQKVRIGPADR